MEQSDQRFIRITKELHDHYMPLFEKAKGTQMYEIYETMVKLNSEMIITALQKYDDIKNNQETD